MSGQNTKQPYGELKIIWHPEKLEALLKGEISAPIAIRIKPTNKCDHRCFFCSYNPEAKNLLSEEINLNDEIPQEKMMEVLSDLGEMGVKAVTYSGGGEPLIYPHIIQTFKKTLDNKLDLSIITNGQRLSEERAELLTQAKWVRISADYCDISTFVQSRRITEKSFDKLKENIKKFAKIKNLECELGINFIVHHMNQDKVYEAANFFKDLGVNHIRYAPRWMEEGWEKYHTSFKENVIEQIKKARQDLNDERFKVYDVYEKDLNNPKIIERPYSKCSIMQIVPVIAADSAVYFCHDKAYTKNGRLGYIKEQSFKDLWFSKESKEKFKNFDAKVECKQHCVYDGKNSLIEEIINSHGNHVNFI
ncbi:MAG: radical SAM protein [Nanoarchaeota archaeon]